jgi:hypothetical protein
MIDYVEDHDIVTEEEREHITNDIVKSPYFPWFWMPSSSSDAYPFYGHVLANRNDREETITNSEYYWNFYEIFDRMIQKHNLFPDGYVVMRAALNDSLSSKDPHCDPHVDHTIPHMVFILYLTENSGSTLIYNEKYEDGKKSIYLNRDGIRDLSIKHTSDPVPFKMIGFDGLHYHSIKFKEPDERRVICVWTVRNK